jgi:hypothetical protein
MSQVEQDMNDGATWSPDVDKLLAKWCDHAKCYEWMHAEAFSDYERRARTFMISINCLTAVSGLSNVIAGGITVGNFQLAWLFGGISLFVSTLNILQDKLGYAAKATLHERLASDWANIRSKIEEVLSIPYGGRKDYKTVMKYIRNDITVAQKAVMIPEEIRDACLEKFKAIKDFDIPDICGQMEHTEVQVVVTPFLRSGSIGSGLTQQPMVIMDT